MKWNDYKLNELDLQLLFLIRDELKVVLGSDADKAIKASEFLNHLQEDPIFVHHFDVAYWVDYIVERFQQSIAV